MTFALWLKPGGDHASPGIMRYNTGWFDSHTVPMLMAFWMARLCTSMALLAALALLCASAVAIGRTIPSATLMYVENFARSREGTGTYLVDADRRLRFHFHDITHCGTEWAPGGEALLFMERAGFENSTIMTVNVRGARRYETLFTGQYLGLATWSPAADRIAFQFGFNQIAQISTDGTGLDVITTFNTINRAINNITWSPTQDYLVIDTAPYGEKAVTGTMWVIDPGSEQVLEAVSGNYASWSPAGDSLLYFASVRGEIGLYLLDVQTGARRFLAGPVSSEVRLHPPLLSPRSSNIAFISGQREITIYNLDTRQARRVDMPEDVIDIGEIGWSSDGSRLAFSAHVSRYGTARQVLYTVNDEGRRPRQIARSSYAAQRETAICEFAWRPG